jgi:hypothetical protein
MPGIEAELIEKQLRTMPRLFVGVLQCTSGDLMANREDCVAIMWMNKKSSLHYRWHNRQLELRLCSSWMRMNYKRPEKSYFFKRNMILWNRVGSTLQNEHPLPNSRPTNVTN